jgi:hypothetical protein
MSVQKTPDGKGKIDDNKIQWEQDLKPFKRLPRDKRPKTEQRVPGWIPLLISFAVIIPLCILGFNILDRIRPAAQSLAIPTATIRIITPTATEFIPPTATPYVAPTDTPIPTSAPPLDAAASGIVVGGKVKVTGTGAGLNFRDQPTTSGAILRKLPDETIAEVIGGPRQANAITWWQLKLDDGTTGWGAQQFLQPQ